MPSQSDLLALLGTDDADAVLRLVGIMASDSMVPTIERGLLRGRAEIHTVGRPPREGDVGSEHRRITLGAASVAHLRKALPMLNRYGSTRQLMIAVLSTDRPDLISLSPALTGEFLYEGGIRVIDGGQGGVVVHLTMRRRAAVYDVVRAVLAMPRQGGGSWPGAGLRLGLTSASVAAWAAGDPWARTASRRALVVPPDDISPVDIVLGPEVRSDTAPLDPPVLDSMANQRPWTWVATAPEADVAAFVDEAVTGLPRPRLPWTVAAPMLPPIDTAVISPRGFVTAPTAAEGRAERRAGRLAWDIKDSNGRRLATLAIDDGVGEADIGRLRSLRHVVLDPADSPGPVELATLLATLVTAGIPVIVTDWLPSVTRELMGPIASDIEALDRDSTGDDLAREAWSVKVRRQALLRFGSSARWQAFGARLGRSTAIPPSISVILPTKRPSNLAFALAQLERQTWPDVEVVIALHGVSARQPEVFAAVARFTRPVQVVEVDKKVIFGDVLNAALDRCSGRFVAKMDDDDWYGAEHLTDLLLAHEYSSAILVGLADHYVYLADTDMTVRDVAHGTERWATRVSGGTLAIARDDLLTIGRWRPTWRAVDRCLIQAVRAFGGHIYAMHDLGFCLFRGGNDHTWNPADKHFVARDPVKWPGFAPPPGLNPLPHPVLSGANAHPAHQADS